VASTAASCWGELAGLPVRCSYCRCRSRDRSWQGLLRDGSWHHQAQQARLLRLLGRTAGATAPGAAHLPHHQEEKAAAAAWGCSVGVAGVSPAAFPATGLLLRQLLGTGGVPGAQLLQPCTVLQAGPRQQALQRPSG
jgi:hypothetical protein